MQSEQINELAEALAKAQGQFEPVAKTGTNPHLNSKYVTFDSIIKTIKGPLSTNGLAYAQLVSSEDNGPTLTTILMHSSGQWIKSSVVIDTLDDHRGGINEMQAFGKSLTYMKRYTLSAILGISSDEDDDGHGSSARPGRAKRQPQASKPPSEPKPKSDGIDLGQVAKDAKEDFAPRQPSMKGLLNRWNELWNEAMELGLEVEPMPADASKDEVIQRGKELAARIDAVKNDDTAWAYPAECIAAVLEAGLSANVYSIKNTTVHAQLTPDDPPDVWVQWFRMYRESRDAGGDVEDAAAVANAWLEGEMEGGE
jgi:hypothetical protein